MTKTNSFNLDAALLKFSDQDVWTLNDATQGTCVMGATGSGKTSGSGATIAKAFLQAGFGGLVMCAKPEERYLWEEYAKATGRQKSLLIFSPEPDTFQNNKLWRFNFLDYELQRQGRGGGHTENIVNLITRIAEIAEGTHDVAGKEQFWERAMRQMVRNAVDILALTGRELTLRDLVRLIRSAPTDREQAYYTPEQETAAKQENKLLWWDTSFCAKCLLEAEEHIKTDRERNDFEVASDYWLNEYPSLGDRTRGGIVTTFTSVADQLLHGIAWELFCTETTIVPEMTYKNGAVIVLDMPVQEYQVLGRVTQGIFKYMFQRAILRRNPQEDPRPVFLWADEAQNFVSSFDYQYQAVARSARACTVYMTQNISNYYSVLGSANSQAETHAFLANLQTKIWHANGDPATNQYAADSVAQTWLNAFSYNIARGNQSGQQSGGASEVVQYKVLPEEFTKLRKGGPENNLQVDGIVFQGGRIWNETGDTYLTATFLQEKR